MAEDKFGSTTVSKKRKPAIRKSTPYGLSGVAKLIDNPNEMPKLAAYIEHHRENIHHAYTDTLWANALSGDHAANIEIILSYANDRAREQAEKMNMVREPMDRAYATLWYWHIWLPTQIDSVREIVQRKDALIEQEGARLAASKQALEAEHMRFAALEADCIRLSDNLTFEREQVETFRQRSAGREQQIIELQHKYDCLQAAHARQEQSIKSYQAQFDVDSKRILEFEAEIAQLNAKIVGLQHEHEAQKKIALDEFNRAEQFNDWLREAYVREEALKQERDVLNGKLIERDREIAAHVKLDTQNQRRIEGLVANLEYSEQRVKAQAGEIILFKQEIADANKRADDFAERIDGLHQECEIDNDAIDKLSERITYLANQRDRLLRERDAERGDHAERIAEMERQRNVANAIMDGLTDQVNELMAQRDSAIAFNVAVGHVERQKDVRIDELCRDNELTKVRLQRTTLALEAQQSITRSLLLAFNDDQRLKFLDSMLTIEADDIDLKENNDDQRHPAAQRDPGEHAGVGEGAYGRDGGGLAAVGDEVNIEDIAAMLGVAPVPATVAGGADWIPDERRDDDPFADLAEQYCPSCGIPHAGECE